MINSKISTSIKTSSGDPRLIVSDFEKRWKAGQTNDNNHAGNSNICS